MNIQQINGNGHGLWVFIVTSVTALLITGATWYSIVETNNIRAWKQYNSGIPPTEGPNYSLGVRIFMLVWLVRNGHASWMWKSRAFSEILTNSTRTFGPVNWQRMPRPGRCYKQPETACEYVSFYTNPYNGWWVEPFSPDSLKTRPST